MKAEGITDEVRNQIDKALRERSDHLNPDPETGENEIGKTQCRANASRHIAEAQRLRNRERQRRLAEREKFKAENRSPLPMTETPDLPRVTADTLTEKQIKVAESLELTGRVYYQMRHEMTVGDEQYKSLWDNGCSALADLINAERELGAAHERAKGQAKCERLHKEVAYLKERLADPSPF